MACGSNGDECGRICLWRKNLMFLSLRNSVLPGVGTCRYSHERIAKKKVPMSNSEVA